MSDAQTAALAALRALGKQKRYRPVFEYLMGRDLPSKATDVYSVKAKGIETATLREALTELERIGFGRFLNRRSFSWEMFDLRAVGRLAVAPKEFDMSYEGLYRADHDFQGELEKRLIHEAMLKTKALNTTKSVDLSRVTEEELIAALEAKGLEVFTRKKIVS